MMMKMMTMMTLLVEALILSNLILITIGGGDLLYCGQILEGPSAAPVLDDINLALSSLSNHSSSSLFFNTSIPSSSSSSAESQIFAMYQCMGDLTLTDCSKCISAALKEVKGQCKNVTSARVKQDDLCFLRYDHHPFFTLDTSLVLQECDNNVSTINPAVTTNLASALASIVEQAPNNHSGYASITVGNPHSSSQVSLFAQCFGYLSPSECGLCLDRASQSLDCPGFQGGSIYLESCYIYYESPLPNNTFPPPPSPPPPAPKTSLGSKTVPVTNPFLAVLFLFLAIAAKW